MRQPQRADPVGVPDPAQPPLWGDHDPWRSAPPDHGHGALLKVLGWLVTAGALAYGGMLALQAYRLAGQVTTTAANPALSPPPSPAPALDDSADAQPPEKRPTARRAPANPADTMAAPALPAQARQVNKCVQAGKVSYSDAPCPQAATGTALYIPREAPVPTPPRAAAPVAMAQVAPPTPAAPPVVVMQPQLLAQAAPDRMTECKALDALITQIDNESRQLLPAWRQDQLRDQKKVARDRQFALRCQ